MIAALSYTSGVVVFVTLIFVTIFRYLDPAIVRDDYRKCAGNWYEAEVCSCSDGLSSIPQQPINTYTNLAYVAAGFFPVFCLGTPASYAFAVTMLYLCVGSALYHATSTRWAGMMDVVAIYVVFSALAMYAAAELLSLPEWLAPFIMFVVGGTVAYLLSPRYHKNMRLIIGLFLGGTYALVLLDMALSSDWLPGLYLLSSLISFALAYAFWSMDRARTFPFPRWGHGLWHILTALASILVFYSIHTVAAHQ